MEFNEIEIGQSQEMPPKIVCYGIPKIGKSRFAAQFPDVFFLDIEGGLQYLDKKVRSTPKLTSFDNIISWLTHIYNNENFTCGRIVIDSLDWAESLAKEKIENIHGEPLTNRAYKPYAYGSGQAMVDDETIRIFRALDMIYEKKKIPSLLIAHSAIKTLDLPNKDPYSKYELKVSKGVSAKAAEWADLILFADYSFHVTKEGKTSEPKPMFLAGGSASFTGGGRMSLNKELPIDYKILEQHITKKDK